MQVNRIEYKGLRPCVDSWSCFHADAIFSFDEFNDLLREMCEVRILQLFQFWMSILEFSGLIGNGPADSGENSHVFKTSFWCCCDIPNIITFQFNSIQFMFICCTYHNTICLTCVQIIEFWGAFHLMLCIMYQLMLLKLETYLTKAGKLYKKKTAKSLLFKCSWLRIFPIWNVLE